MKSLISLSFILLLAAVTGCKSPEKAAGSHPSSTGTERVMYVCPMHPDVTSDKPGKCPKCGMELEKKSK
jgi:hypothetical protein